MKKFVRENRAVVIMMLVYFLVVGTVTILRHYTFQTQTWDMGAFVQTMWQATEGRGLINSLEQVPNHLGVHMSPFLFLLVPIYAIFKTPYSLLIIQTLALALGALPLYLLAKDVFQSHSGGALMTSSQQATIESQASSKIKRSYRPDKSGLQDDNNNKLPLIIVVIYLLYPSLHAANLFDFHSVAFAVPLFLAALYYIHREKLLWASVFLILGAGTKENAIISTVFIGLFILIKYFKRRQMRNFGLTVFLIASIYFYLTVAVFMPAAGGGLVRFDRYANLGATPGEIVTNVTQEPGLLAETILTADKGGYVARLFLPVLYVSLLAPLYLLPLIPGLAQNLLTFFDFQFSSLYQYDSIIIPFIFLAAIFGIKKVWTIFPKIQKYLSWILLIASVTSFGLFSILSPKNLPFKKFNINDRVKAFQQIIPLIPDDVSVTANSNLVPHLAHREIILMQGTGTQLTDIFVFDGFDPFPFKTEEEFQKYFDVILDSKQYQVNIIEDRYFILTRK